MGISHHMIVCLIFQHAFWSNIDVTRKYVLRLFKYFLGILVFIG